MDELLQEMIAPAPSRSDMARRRRLVSTFVIVALAVVGVTALTTSALFTDNESSTGGGITTGTVDLSTSKVLDFAIPAGVGMAPGDAAFATISVTNSGSLSYRYAVAYQATDDDTTPGTLALPTDVTVTSAFLSSQLQLTSYQLDATDGVPSCDHDGTDAATTRTLATTGSGLKTTPLTKLIGDSGQGSQTGDRILNAGSSETLCFRVDLPIGTSNDYQDTSTTITLRLDAEQTVNN